MAYVTDDSASEPPSADVASLAAHYFARAREQAARAGAPAELVADVAAIGELTAQIDALRASPPPAPEADGSDIIRRYERAAETQELTAQLADVMVRVTADEPDAADVWRVVAEAQRASAALARQAAAYVTDAGPAPKL